MDAYPVTKVRSAHISEVFEAEAPFTAPQADDGNRNEVQAKTTRVQRLFNFAQIFFLSLTFMSSWETMGLNLYVVFLNGGPQTLAWGVIIVVVGACAQAASLAEMASMLPLAGAQYHWTHLLAPAKIQNFVTWTQGWITWFAWIATLGGIVNTTATMLQALVILNHPDDYEPHRFHTTLLILGIAILLGLINIYVFAVIPWIELTSGILHLILFVTYSVVLVSLARRHSSSWVWFERVDSSTTSGWSNGFVSWNLGLLMPTWGFVGFDGAVHLSEEVRRARTAIPRVMFWTIAINGVLAFAFSLVILYAAGDIAAALDSPTGQPFLEVCRQATQSTKVATAMGSGLLIISFSVSLACIASVSRLTWAWARDGALPRIFARVSPSQRVPVNAILLTLFCVVLLGIINIPSTIAFQALISLASFALYTSYLVAISCMLHARWRSWRKSATGLTSSSIWEVQPYEWPPTCKEEGEQQPLQMGEWRIGSQKVGAAVNVFAWLYTAYIMFWLPWPPSYPVSGSNMNYAIVIFGAVLLGSTCWWFAAGRIPGTHKWRGIDMDVAHEAVKEE